MQRLAPLQHRHECRDAPRPRLGLASRLHAVQDRVAVLRVQRLEERRRTRRGVEGGLQIVGHRGRARGVVRGVPPAVRLRPLDLAQARRLHPAGLDQRRRELAVALGPDAPCPPRREALQVERVVEAARLAVNPPDAERRMQRLHVRDGRDPRALARELDPDAGLGLVVGAQPRLPLRRRGERTGLYGETSSKRLSRVATPNIMGRQIEAEDDDRRTACRRRPTAPRQRAAGNRPTDARTRRAGRILGRVAETAGTPAPGAPEPWDANAALVAHLGARGAAAFRAMFDAFPEAVGLLWAIRDDDGRIVDFDFGYGNPAIMDMFRLPRTQAGRYTALEALPQMREDGSFERYVHVCDTGEPWVNEVSFDTPFGDGYVRGTFLRRTGKLGDGLIVLMTDITVQRRREAELRGFADMVAHDLREPVTGIAHLVTLLERRAGTPPDPAVLDLLRASTERARGLIDGVLAYARAGELEAEPVDLGTLMGEVAADLRPRLERRARRSRWASCPRSAAMRASCAACCRTSSATR